MDSITKFTKALPINVHQEEATDINKQIQIPLAAPISNMGIANINDGFETSSMTTLETSLLSIPFNSEVTLSPAAETVEASSIFQPIGSQQVDLELPIEPPRDLVQEAIDQIKAEASKENPIL